MIRHHPSSGATARSQTTTDPVPVLPYGQRASATPRKARVSLLERRTTWAVICTLLAGGYYYVVEYRPKAKIEQQLVIDQQEKDKTTADLIRVRQETQRFVDEDRRKMAADLAAAKAASN